tara:strand:+ start:15785 stop:16201 length:417 start_codon:yes stop_codon:yes gene_type:complete
MKTQTITTQQNVFKNVGTIALIMVFWLFANPIIAQSTERTVTGVVTSNDGPLFGASIVLKGTIVGVSSNDDGTFKFPKMLKENDVLVVSYLGYKNREIKIGNATTYVEPFLDDIPVIIECALRTKNGAAMVDDNKDGM